MVLLRLVIPLSSCRTCPPDSMMPSIHSKAHTISHSVLKQYVCIGHGHKAQETLLGGPAHRGDNVATAIAAMGYTVVLGDKEGNLHRWELATGRVSTIPVGQVASCTSSL